MTINVGGGVSIIGIYYTIFSNFFVLLFVRIPLPSWGKPYANIFWEHCLLPLLKFASHFRKAKVIYKHNSILFSNSQLWTKTTFAQSNEGKYSTILTLWCSSRGWNFISACTLILTQLGQVGQNSTWAENTLWNQPLNYTGCLKKVHPFKNEIVSSCL